LKTRIPKVITAPQTYYLIVKETFPVKNPTRRTLKILKNKHKKINSLLATFRQCLEWIANHLEGCVTT
jgi:hypothetical protein